MDTKGREEQLFDSRIELGNVEIAKRMMKSTVKSIGEDLGKAIKTYLEGYYSDPQRTLLPTMIVNLWVMNGWTILDNGWAILNSLSTNYFILKAINNLELTAICTIAPVLTNGISSYLRKKYEESTRTV